jgi:hypothetical protein
VSPSSPSKCRKCMPFCQYLYTKQHAHFTLNSVRPPSVGRGLSASCLCSRLTYLWDFCPLSCNDPNVTLAFTVNCKCNTWAYSFTETKFNQPYIVKSLHWTWSAEHWHVCHVRVTSFSFECNFLNLLQCSVRISHTFSHHGNKIRKISEPTKLNQ